MRKKMRIKIVIKLAVLLLFLFSCSNNENERPIPKIEVYQTVEQDILVYQEFVGQVYGLKDIAIRARVEGELIGIYFQEGSTVKKGDPLYKIDAQPYEAEVAAKMSQVAEAKTMLAKAQSDLNRIKPLAKQKAVSQSDLDGAVAQYDASVASLKAAKAVLRASQIQLGYTKISSPISGLIGRTKAKVGDFVGRNPNPVILNVVSNIETILVQFFITEKQYLSIKRFALTDEFINRDEEERANIELILADDSFYKHKGKIDFIDREVDSQTGAILVQASFPNPDKLIRPGQFAKLKINVNVIENGIKIPERCITELQGIYNVYVISDSSTIKQKQVEVGSRYNNFRVITKGLNPGEKVVYEGLQQVRQGMRVEPVIVEVEQITIEKR